MSRIDRGFWLLIALSVWQVVSAFITDDPARVGGYWTSANVFAAAAIVLTYLAPPAPKPPPPDRYRYTRQDQEDPDA
jgi:hypothetical protein